jgi:putative exporter of polyketide antibiotics
MKTTGRIKTSFIIKTFAVLVVATIIIVVPPVIKIKSEE